MAKNNHNLVTGLAWYRREQWPLLREVAADPEILEETYDAWLRIAQKAAVDLALEGVRAERVDIDVEELVKWCRANSRLVDSSARAQFTSRKLKAKYEQEGEEAR